jgi:serine/threonine-protein kinase
MNEVHDPNRTVDEAPSAPADSLDGGLAAGFAAPRSSLGASQRPLLLKEAQGDSAHVVKPHSDAMPPPEQTGTRYQLQGEIARGGMGAVLRGRDVDLGRDLAVKVLLQKHANRPEVARRFIEEAQIGGQLQHPGVVPVYDIGRFGERPFFTMKLVKGQTLQALLAERAEPSVDRPRFLGIALQVAQTLAYAHAKGVIHRDLKPANIMVGAFGEVQVMDWGLAKVLAEGGVADEERASRQHQHEEGTQIRTARSSGSAGTFGTQTEAGSLLGTPAYMPPEQANGDVVNLDRRADVFGLGAILCEILTGKPPYVGRSHEEVRRKACNGDLADTTARLDACGADAELIASTKACLAAEAIDRPKDAQAVADGLSGYLNGVQERLHQAELAEAEARAKAVEEARRRRLTLALAATVLLALTLGGGGWLWVKSEHDARQAKMTREVNEALNQATALREQARTAPTGGAALFTQARELVARARALVDNGPADPDLVSQVERLQDDLDEEEKDRKLVAALDDARLAQAETLSENRFAPERAVPKFREAFAAYGLPAGEGEPEAAAQRIRQRPAAVREAMLDALDEWGSLAADEKLELAEPHREWLRAVLETVEPAQGWMRRFWAARDEKDAGKRKSALEKLAQEKDVGTLPVRALTRLAWQLDNVEAYAAAAQLLRRAQRQHPADFWVNELLGLVLEKLTPPEWDEAVRFRTAAVALRPDSPGAQFNLGVALVRKGQVDEAIACYQKAIGLDAKYAAAHNNLGNALSKKGQVDEAIACYRQAIQLYPKLAVAHTNLGAALHQKGQVEEAIVCLRKTVELTPNDAVAHTNLGNVLKDKGKEDEAIACFRKTVELAPNDAAAHTNLGRALNDRGKVEEAIACFEKAIVLDPKYALAHTNLGKALRDKGRIDEAIACLRKAIALDPKLAEAHYTLGKALDDKGRVDEAIDCLRKAIELDPKLADAHLDLGAILCDVKRDYDGAMACFKKAIALDPKSAAAHNNMGTALKGKGEMEQAVACWRKAIELDPKDALAHCNLGAALDEKGQLDEAITCLRTAIRLDPKHVKAHGNLGKALSHKDLVDEAITCYRKAIVLDPKHADSYFNLGNLLDGKDQVDEAIACWRKAIELDPKHAAAHCNLGITLARRGHIDLAIASFRKAIEANPKLPETHRNLGTALAGKGQVDDAIACYQKAIALDPKHARDHYHLGHVLRENGRWDEAVACYQKAIAIDAKYAEAHCNLGSVLEAQGRFAESLAAYQRGHELGTKQPGWRYPSARWVRQAAAKAALEAKLPAFLKGEFQPNGSTERLALARVCQAKKLNHAAARLYLDLFAAEPKLADDLGAAHRYRAACAALLAAAGQGKDAGKLDDKEKARLRKQALDWLRADLALRTKQLESGQPAERAAVQRALRHWQKDSDLAGLRDKTAQAKLPADEQKACTQLWADVAALLKKAEEKPK